MTLTICFILALYQGAEPLSLLQIVKSITQVSRLPISQHLILYQLRIPNCIAALLVGAALGMAGTAMQGLLRNPLADPTLLGSSTGASLVIIILMILASKIPWIISNEQWLRPLAAFAGSLIVMIILLLIMQLSTGSKVATMLLAGMSLNALLAATSVFLLTIANSHTVHNALFWSFGGINATDWHLIYPNLTIISLACILLYQQGRRLDLLALGESSAFTLGMPINKTYRTTIIAIALLIAASVSLAGPIAFIGLLVPHINRAILGPRHRPLLLASILTGAIFMLLAYSFCLSALSPRILPLGVATSILGAPFFIALLFRRTIWC